VTLVKVSDERGRNAQVTADGLGDLPDRNALVAHGVQP
jgi:hypothetical protein